jgi:hypothetical protein
MLIGYTSSQLLFVLMNESLFKGGCQMRGRNFLLGRCSGHGFPGLARRLLAIRQSISGFRGGVRRSAAFRSLIVLVAILGAAPVGGCGGGGSSPTQPAVTSPSATELANVIVQSYNNATAGKALAKTQVYVPFDTRVGCSGGGYTETSGSISGNENFLSIGGQTTLTNCGDQGYVLNGDPYVSFAGTFSALSGNLQIRFGGAVRWTGGGGTGSCPISLTLIADSRSGHVSGSVCGQQVDYHS